MAIQKRERMMALVLGGFVGLIVLYWGFSKYQSMFAMRQGKITSLTKDVSEKEAQVARINRAEAQRRELQKRSLPADTYFAQNLYQSWLVSLVNGKLTDPSVTPRSAQGKPTGFEKLGFDVKGQGTLAQITRLLFDFYASNYLHRINTFDIKPDPKTNTLTLNMHVEPIILPGTDRKDKLPTEPGSPLAHQSYSDYEKAIVGRNLFAEYTPPAISRPERTDPPLDLAKLAFVTNIGHGVDNRPFVWIYERNTNKTTYLFTGDQFEVAGLKGKVLRIDIDGRSAEFEINGKPVTVWLDRNQSLGDALAELQK